MKINCEDGRVFADTRTGRESAKLPVLITVERGYVLRFPSIFSKVGDVEIIDNEKLGCDNSKCGLEGSPTRVLEAFENESGKIKCRFISKDEFLPLVERLMKQEGCEEKKNTNRAKLKNAWVVGEEVVEKAKEIADEVIFIEKSTPEEIAKRAIEEKPYVILWNADLWGRKNAPIVAAMLDTGLCADCTMLDANGCTFSF